MRKIKKILVGIDIFGKSNNVLKRALLVAKKNKAELFIVHAVHTPWLSLPSYFSSKGSKDLTVDTKGITKKINKKLENLNSKIQVPYTIIVKEGTAHDILGYEATLLKADLIVIGANTSGKKKMLGSTAEKVAHQSHLPVLIVKNSVKGTYKNIIAPTDFETQSKQSIVYAKTLFPKASIKVVHSLEVIYMDIQGPYTMVGRDLSQYNDVALSCAQKDLKDLAKDLSIERAEILNGKTNTKKTLLDYIKKGSYDLTVVGSRGTAGFNILLGSMASSILKDVNTDVLVYVP